VSHFNFHIEISRNVGNESNYYGVVISAQIQIDIIFRELIHK